MIGTAAAVGGLLAGGGGLCTGAAALVGTLRGRGHVAELRAAVAALAEETAQCHHDRAELIVTVDELRAELARVGPLGNGHP